MPGAAQILAIRRKARNLPQAPILLIMQVEMRTYLSLCAGRELGDINLRRQVESTGVGSSQNVGAMPEIRGSQMRASITP